jgi:NAD(P)-dependent dehydrogenase (short-subunit alcohol dehydrogenase family)
MPRLAGKVAIVTGASSGIGRAAARLFASEGASVVACARNAAALDALLAEIEASGGAAVTLAGDVRDEDVARRLVSIAEDRFGGLDIGFNNAGTVGPGGAMIELTADDWHEILDTNLTGAFFGAKHQVPAFRRRGGGSLIFTSSFVGVGAGIAGMVAYAASKAGLIGLTQALAVEVGAEAIRVNALVVGGTDTGLNPARAPGAGPEVLAFVAGLHALRRIAEPLEIAQAALFLASDESSFVTGSAMAVDGGASITKA